MDKEWYMPPDLVKKIWRLDDIHFRADTSNKPHADAFPSCRMLARSPAPVFLVLVPSSPRRTSRQAQKSRTGCSGTIKMERLHEKKSSLLRQPAEQLLAALMI